MPSRIVLVALWLLLPLGLRAQPARPEPAPPFPTRVDSQQAWLRRPNLPDTVRVQLLLSLSRHHMATNLDSARALSQQAASLARRTGYGWGLARALNSLAASFYYASDYPAAQRTFEQALRAAQQVGRPELIGHAYLGLGNVASELSNQAGLQQYYALAQQAYAAAKPRFVSGELLVLGNRANHYLNELKPRQAAPLVRQALALLRQFPQAGRLSMFQSQLGRVQAMQQQADSAAATFTLAARQGRTDHDGQAEGEAWLHLGALEVSRQQFAAALPYARRAATLMRRLGDVQQVAEALDVQAIALAGLRRPEAYDTLRRYTTLRDSLLSQERIEAVATAQARFDQTEQQARIRALEQQRRIEHLEAEQRTTRSRLQLGSLAGAGVLLGLLGLGAYRRRQRRREEALRHQLAADLHDDVGSLLSRIALQTDLLQEGLAPPAQLQEQWAEVAGNSRLAVRQLNDVVWNLDAQNDSVPNLLDRLRDYAHEVLVPAGFDVRFVAEETAGAGVDLPAPVRRQLYLVYKEALHNILKYAPADALVTVLLRRGQRELVLEIVNTGPVLTPGTGRVSGHGLRNIRERAAALGGMASMGPEAAGGFAVRVRMPV